MGGLTRQRLQLLRPRQWCCDQSCDQVPTQMRINCRIGMDIHEAKLHVGVQELQQLQLQDSTLYSSKHVASVGVHLHSVNLDWTTNGLRS